MPGVLDTTRNFSLYSIPAAWLLAFVPHMYAICSSKAFDKCSPRDFPKSLEADQSLEMAKKKRIRRTHAAAANGFENVGLFASAVVAGNVAGLSHSTLNGLTGAYVISRVVYNFIYINNESNGAATARVVVWFSGILLNFTLFIKSGRILTNKTPNLL